MPERMKKPRTDSVLYYVECPSGKAGEARDYLRRLGCHVHDDVDARDVFPDRSPATLLSGARYRESLTQARLAELTGIPRRHISEMENNRRPIGKANARKLAEALGIDYRMLL
jgi:DNA-binding XRE family transcriptional regulator